MKCARCGNEVDPRAPVCPFCNGEKAAEKESAGEAPREHTDRCPVCGSPNVYAVRKGYDSCCGCLGLLLFSWVGLLLGLLGSGRIEMHCRDCGAVWPFQR